MPRKKRTDDDGNEHYQQVVEMDPQDAKVRKILQAMPGGLKCMNLFRYPEGNKGGRPEYIDEISPEQFSFQGIKQSFGGGRFFVEWENADGTCTRSNFDIAGSYRDFKDPKPVEDEEDDEPMKQIHQPQPVQQNQGIDPVQLMMMLQKAEERAEARIIKMMEMLRPQQIQQPPDMTKQVFEIVEKLAPMMQGDSGNPILSVIGQFREPIMKIIDSVHAAMTRPAVAPSGPPPTVHAHVEHPNPQHPSEEDMLKLLIRQYLPVFVNAARSNGNPDLYADMILDQIPESMYPKLVEWLKGDWFKDIVAIEKNVEFQAGWWNLLKTSLIQGIEDHATSDLQPASNSEHSED